MNHTAHGAPLFSTFETLLIRHLPAPRLVFGSDERRLLRRTATRTLRRGRALATIESREVQVLRRIGLPALS